MSQAFLVGPAVWVIGCGEGTDAPRGPRGDGGAGGEPPTPIAVDVGDGVPLHYRLERGWRFARDFTDEAAAAADFEDVAWETVNLPHTARIEALVTGPPGSDTYQWQGDCWYRRRLDFGEEVRDRPVWIRFAGAMNTAEVWLDGEKIGEHLGGWLPFTIDLSGLVEAGGAHLLAIHLDNRSNSTTGPKGLTLLDYNYYHGLYREVEVVVKARLHITDPILVERPASGGVFVTFPTVSVERAEVAVQVHVKNADSVQRLVAARLTLTDANGNVVANGETLPQALAAGADVELLHLLEVFEPALWNPRRPALHLLRVELLGEGEVVDEESLRVGIRRIEIDATGFRINGEPMFLRGVNRHQEYPYLGYALTDAAQHRDAKKIKDAGFDFVRLSHYAQSPAFMSACDELGLAVMNCIPGWQYFVDTDAFKQNQYENIRRLVRRDRNHPCVVLWEVSLNESEMTGDFIAEAHTIAHEEYPGDQCFTAGWRNGYDVFVQARQHGGCHGITDRACLVSEYGDWEYYAGNAGFNQEGWQDLSPDAANSRQLRWHGERALLQQATNFQEAANDNLTTIAFADGLWVMFDYNRGYAPDLESSGCMDIFRLPKFSYHFFRSQRGPDEAYPGVEAGPMVFIASYWMEDSATDVRVFSNCDEVELFRDGTSLGRRSPDADRISTELAHPPFTFAVGTFTPGTLEAVAYLRGAEVARHSVSTPGSIAVLALSLDESGRPFAAEGKDAAFVHAEFRDANGSLVPDAWENVSFGVTGGAALVGQNPFSADGGIASIVLSAEAPAPGAVVYALAIIPEAGAFRILDASLAVGGTVAAAALHATTDGSNPTSSSPLYSEPIAAARVRAALVVGGEVVASADSSTERFRVQGSQTPA